MLINCQTRENSITSGGKPARGEKQNRNERTAEKAQNQAAFQIASKGANRRSFPGKLGKKLSQ